MTDLTRDIDASLVIDLSLLAMLLVLAVAIARTRQLLAAILLMGVYSLVCAVWFMVMDAPDVAFTEAVVGAGVSTIILLGAILLTHGHAEKSSAIRLLAPALAAIAVGGMLVYAVLDLPAFGNPTSPANAHVSRTYLEVASNEIGTPNIVTAVLASYRGFDTLGEATVIFAAAVGVSLMLGFGDLSAGRRTPDSMGDHHVVLGVTAKLFVPVIILFALYVQFHGDLGPGGGFQAGVLLAVVVILHALVFGLRETMLAVRPGFVRGGAALGVLLYAGVGLVCIVNDGAFLDYDYLFPPEIEAQIPPGLLGDPDHPHHWGQHFGIFFIELGVLFTVAAAMISIFYGFAGRAPVPPGTEAGQ